MKKLLVLMIVVISVFAFSVQLSGAFRFMPNGDTYPDGTPKGANGFRISNLDSFIGLSIEGYMPNDPRHPDFLEFNAFVLGVLKLGIIDVYGGVSPILLFNLQDPSTTETTPSGGLYHSLNPFVLKGGAELNLGAINIIGEAYFVTNDKFRHFDQLGYALGVGLTF
ncbi:hypothetical protein OSSY52_03410 [Tepiditoga spiralis]|uniref:Outer membrane protein beta-barrel domain-containing protein n=1 Tax=Tepiditoga spiralis TaxID=2108365 RepID=A0A7G1G1S9_9BACT|nr:hypothetical protein [Tepiditoga spiralis]BBE30200.1 hypothetical protein OSSY52_03410 [Tepiditoga spiralis]